MADATTRMHTTSHRFAANLPTRYILFETRHIFHNSVTTQARLVHQSGACRALASGVTSVASVWVPAGARAHAVKRANEWRGPAHNRSLLDGASARANNVVKSSLQAAMTLASMAELLALMRTAAKLLVTSNSTYM